MNDKIAQSINASLQHNWEDAVILNNEILEEDPNNIPALNRLGKAYLELGQADLAKSVYKRVLDIDKFNLVAIRNLKLLKNKLTKNDDCQFADENFIEDAGLTKTVQLVKLASKDTLLGLAYRQRLELVPKTRLVSVCTEDSLVLGSLPDDLSLKLKKFLKLGYKYLVCVRSYSENHLSVFIREIKRPRSLTAASSFARNQNNSIESSPK